MSTAEDITDRVRKIKAAGHYPGGWDAIDAQLRAAHRRDQRGGHVVADGFPSGTMGGAGGGASVRAVDPDTGEEVNVGVTSVEAAVIRRLEPTAQRDVYHREVARALEWLDEAARAVGAAAHCMNKLAELDGHKPAMEHCGSCAAAGVEELELDLPLRYGRAGVLERSAWLCRSCYRFANNHRRLPTAEEVGRYRDGKALRPLREQAS